MARALDLLPPLADDVAVELIRPGETDYNDYNELLAKLRGIDKELYRGREAIRLIERVSGRCHDHHHDHGVTAKSYRLQPEVSVAQVESLLLPYVTDDDAPLLRAKGITGREEEFDLVGDEWSIASQRFMNNADQTMNVIFGEKYQLIFCET